MHHSPLPPPPTPGAHSLWAQLGETVRTHHTVITRKRPGNARAIRGPPQSHSCHVMGCPAKTATQPAWRRPDIVPS